MGKIIITGPGRSGTTFLVQLLTRLGFDTGFEPYNETGYKPELRAGLEWPVLNEIDFSKHGHSEIKQMIVDAPGILKGPEWALVLKELLKRDLIDIDHVIIATRDLEEAARSRLAVGLDWMVTPNGDHEAMVADQTSVLAMVLGKTIEACETFNLAYTITKFPHLVHSGMYCFIVLVQALPLDAAAFFPVFRDLANPNLVTQGI